VNKQERTYTVLRDRIHSGAFAPRARLNIDGLARELGVSAIPVREALRRLEAEGWVRFQPNVGAIVAPVDATTWEQEMVAVAILEGAATADAAAHLRLSDLSRLRRIAAEMEAVAAAHGDPVKFSRLNRRLHAATPTFSSCWSRRTCGWTGSAPRCSPTCPSASSPSSPSTLTSSTCWKPATRPRSSNTPAGTSCKPSRPTAPPTNPS
jgi:DNA-binding transcriptional regulator YhcF (GntR family)